MEYTKLPDGRIVYWMEPTLTGSGQYISGTIAVSSNDDLTPENFVHNEDNLKLLFEALMEKYGKFTT